MSTQPDITKYCLNCRYNLSGLPQPRCPECGTPFDLDDPLTYYTKFSFRRLLARTVRYAVILLIAAVPMTILTRAIFVFTQDPPPTMVIGYPGYSSNVGFMTRGLTKYTFDTGRLPKTNEFWYVFFAPPSDDAGRWRGPYIDDPKILIDRWANPYRYRSPGTHNKDGYDLWSAGPDRKDHTPDDITNWTSPQNESPKPKRAGPSSAQVNFPVPQSSSNSLNPSFPRPYPIR